MSAEHWKVIVTEKIIEVREYRISKSAASTAAAAAQMARHMWVECGLSPYQNHGATVEERLYEVDGSEPNAALQEFDEGEILALAKEKDGED